MTKPQSIVFVVDDDAAIRKALASLIRSVAVWSPRIASMPAIWVKLAVQEFELVISRATCVARSARITP